MDRKGITFYGVLMYLAFAFYIIMGTLWFLMSLMGPGHNFNYQAFALVAVFSVQAWYKKPLTNLILGILSLALSIFMLLQEIETENLFAKTAVVDGYTKAILWFCVTSIAASLILIFSYVKFGFKDN